MHIRLCGVDMGYSSSAALFVSSSDHSLVEKIGVIPVTELFLPHLISH